MAIGSGKFERAVVVGRVWVEEGAGAVEEGILELAEVDCFVGPD